MSTQFNPAQVNSRFGWQGIRALFLAIWLLAPLMGTAQQLPRYVADELLVQFHPGVPVEEADQLHRQLGGHRVLCRRQGLDWLQLAAGHSLDYVWQAYEEHPAVAFAEPNYYAYPQHELHPDDPSYQSGSQWGLAKIDAARAWATITGDSTIIVAVIDSGVDYNHPDLAANMWTNFNESINGQDDDDNGYVDDLRGWNFYDGTNDPIDAFGHGTRVAGIIGAVGNNARGIAGVNWKVRLMPLRISNDSGFSSTTFILRAIDYAVQNGARVINLSYTFSSTSTAIRSAIERANEAGVLFVTIAGNNGRDIDDSPIYPASFNLPNMITVAATESNDNLRSASNYGANTVHLAAPGTSILSTAPGNRYGSGSGTSYAAPFVAGAAALLMAQYPELTHLEVKARLLANVDEVPALQGKVATGGRLNVYRALMDGVEPVGPQEGIDGILAASIAVQAWQDTVRLEVADADLDLDPLQVDTALVEVVHLRSGAAVQVELLETGPSTGIFRARLPVDDGRLPDLQPGDQLWVSYLDALTAQGEAAERTAPIEVIDRFGDLSGDGAVSSLDAHAVLRFAAGLDTPSTQQQLTGNVSGSGQLQDFDAILILQFVVGLRDYFPVQESNSYHPF